MGYHPRLEPFKFLSAHQRVVGNPTEKINGNKKCQFEFSGRNFHEFESYGPLMTCCFLFLEPKWREDFLTY